MIGSFRLVRVADGIVSSGEPSKADLEKCRAMGKALGEAALEKAEESKERLLLNETPLFFSNFSKGLFLGVQ